MEAAAPRDISLLVDDVDLVTMDGEGRVLRGAAIAIDGNRIVWIGPRHEAGALFRAQSRIDGRGKIAMPGMIDAHFHTAQQFLRGKLAMISRTRAPKMPVWRHYYVPYEGSLSEEDVHLSGLVAYTNMLKVGTTCFAEAGGPHPDAMGRAADEVGIRGFIALSTLDSPGVPDSMKLTTAEAYDRNVALVKRWRDHARVHATLALRQVIVCSAELTKGIAAAARDLDVKIHTHLAEGGYEVDFTLERYGKRPTEYLEDLGVLSHHLHCAHSVLLSPEEVDLYAKYRLSACHCGFHNYAIGQPRVVEMWRRGIDIGLGTDGAASSATLDLFRSAHAARIGQQVLAGTPFMMRTAITAEELLKIATNGGARALGLAGEIGVVAAGAKADIILIDTADIDQQPAVDPFFTVSTTATGRDVDTVIVDGRVVMQGREILTVDMVALKARLASRYPEIMARFDALTA